MNTSTKLSGLAASEYDDYRDFFRSILEGLITNSGGRMLADEAAYKAKLSNAHELTLQLLAHLAKVRAEMGVKKS